MSASMNSTLTLRSKIEEDHLTCTVCMCNFDKPKALPCLHTFCEGCLRDFIYGRGHDSQGNFPCPICRAVTEIPAGGVQCFPANHLVTSLLDTVEDARRAPKVPPRPKPRTLPTAPPEYSAEGGGILVSTKNNQTTPLYPDLTGMTSLPSYNDVISQQQQNHVLPCSNGMVQRFGKYGPGLVDFLNPVGLAISRTEEYVVADKGGNRILIFSSSGELKSKFVCNKCQIKDVTVTLRNDILVSVTGSGSAIMHLYSMNGKLISELGQHYRFENPCGIVSMNDGHIAVTGPSTFGVYIFTSQYKYSGVTIGRKGSGDERFLSPCHVTSDTKSHVIVSDSANHNIQVFSPTGKFKLRFGGEGGNHGYLKAPQGVATDTKDNIVVADSDNYRVEIFSPKGRYLTTLVQDTYEIGCEVKPIKVAVTRDNRFVVLFVGPQFAEVRVYMPRISQLSTAESQQTDSCKTQ